MNSQQYVHSWNSNRQMEIPDDPRLESYCTFRVDGFLYGIEVRKVQEVIRGQLTTRVPLAPKAIRGLTNLRGQIVNLMDIREALGLPTESFNKHCRQRDIRREMNVVVRSADGPISLVVDEIGDVLEVRPEQHESLPSSLPSRQRDLLKGACKLDDCLLLILDADRIEQLAT